VKLVRRLLALDDPQEVRFWLFLAAFATVIGVIYWFASYEIVGTVLLLGFGLATGLLGLRLHVDPGARRVRGEAGRRPAQPVPDVDVPASGRAGVDRPFLDEEGRLPTPTLAPLAVGAGVALIATGAIFGSAPVAVGLLPLGWGAWAWLAGARDELDAVASEDVDDEGERLAPGWRERPP
jgi:hypothetical protein